MIAEQLLKKNVVKIENLVKQEYGTKPYSIIDLL